MIKKKKKIIIAIIVFVIVFICICIIMSYLHRDDEFLKGANGNAMTYINDVHPNKYLITHNSTISIAETIIIIFNALCFFLIFVILQSFL